MEIQRLLLPKDDAKNIRAMYVDGRGFDILEDAFHCREGAVITTLSYFNAFTVSKWKKYTKLANLKLVLSLKGDFEIRVYGASIVEGKLATELVAEESFRQSKKGRVEIELPFDKLHDTSLYWEARLLGKTGIVYGSAYETQLPEEEINDIRLAVGICTFRREEFLIPNLRKLDAAILDPNSLLYNNLDVYVSDNGDSKQLKELELESGRFKVVTNPNFGGASGFCRTMIESLKSKKPYTHFLFLDDDVEINLSAIERNVSFLRVLKPEFKMALIGGAMFSIDDQWLQFESAAESRETRFIFNRRDIDLRDPFQVVSNEIEFSANYNAWCYCCTPYAYLSASNLPNPIFFHMDDVEYSLRNKVKVITLNGINVWHLYRKAIHSPKNDYYDVRNRLITLSEIDPPSAIRIADIYLDAFTQSALRYHYASAINAINGILDFCKGFDYFKSLHTGKKHAELESDPQGWIDIDENAHLDQLTLSTPFVRYPGYKNDIVKKTLKVKKGIKVVLKDNTIADAMEASTNILIDVKNNKYTVYKRDLKKLSRVLLLNREAHKQIRENLRKAVDEFHNRLPEVQNLDFWNRYLGLTEGPDTRKKVIFVASDNSRTSGAFRSMTVLATLLRDQYDMNVTVVLPYANGTGASYLRENGVKFTVIESRDWILPMNASAEAIASKKATMAEWNNKAVEQFIRLFRAEKPDVVHINTSYHYAAALAAKETGTRLCWHIREFLEEDQQRTFVDKKAALELMERFPIIAISDAIADKYKAQLPHGDVTRIYNGIDGKQFYKKDHAILDKEKIRVLCIGVVYEGKGQHLLLEALAKLPEEKRARFELVFAGLNDTHPYKERVEGIIAKNHLQKYVTFLGPINNVDEEYAKSDVLAVCARAEAFGRTTVEAMMGGLLVIGAKSGGTVELIQDQETGLLFEPENADDLSKKLLECLEKQKVCNKIALAGQKRAMELYTAEENAKNIHDFYVSKMKLEAK